MDGVTLERHEGADKRADGVSPAQITWGSFSYQTALLKVTGKLLTTKKKYTRVFFFSLILLNISRITSSWSDPSLCSQYYLLAALWVPSASSSSSRSQPGFSSITRALLVPSSAILRLAVFSCCSVSWKRVTTPKDSAFLGKKVISKMISLSLTAPFTHLFGPSRTSQPKHSIESSSSVCLKCK